MLLINFMIDGHGCTLVQFGLWSGVMIEYKLKIGETGMPSQVFITQENLNLNYVPAEKYGEIVFLTKNDYSPIRNSLNNLDMVNHIRRELKSFDPQTDFLITSGSPVVAGLVFMLLSEITKVVNVLSWSNRDKMYQHVVIEI